MERLHAELEESLLNEVKQEFSKEKLQLAFRPRSRLNNGGAPLSRSHQRSTCLPPSRRYQDPRTDLSSSPHDASALKRLDGDMLQQGARFSKQDAALFSLIDSYIGIEQQAPKELNGRAPKRSISPIQRARSSLSKHREHNCRSLRNSNSRSLSVGFSQRSATRKRRKKAMESKEEKQRRKSNYDSLLRSLDSLDDRQKRAVLDNVNFVNAGHADDARESETGLRESIHEHLNQQRVEYALAVNHRPHRREFLKLKYDDSREGQDSSSERHDALSMQSGLTQLQEDNPGRGSRVLLEFQKMFLSNTPPG